MRCLEEVPCIQLVIFFKEQTPIIQSKKRKNKPFCLYSAQNFIFKGTSVEPIAHSKCKLCITWSISCTHKVMFCHKTAGFSSNNTKIDVFNCIPLWSRHGFACVIALHCLIGLRWFDGGFRRNLSLNRPLKTRCPPGLNVLISSCSRKSFSHTQVLSKLPVRSVISLRTEACWSALLCSRRAVAARVDVLESASVCVCVCERERERERESVCV